MVHGGITNSTIASNAQSNQTNDNMEKLADDSPTDGPIQCSICLKTFAKAQQLNVHMNTAHAMTTTVSENDEEDPSSTDKITDIAME